jgi:hypothetical protein
VFEITQAAMDELRARRARRAAEICLVGKEDGQSATSGIRGNTAAIHPAADDREIVCIRRSHALAACGSG